MPSTSKKQHNFMEAIAHSPSFAKKAGVPQSVGQDFAKADKGRKFSKGGDMKTKKFGGGGATAEDMMKSIVGLTPNTGNYALSDAVNQLKTRQNAPAAMPARPMPAPMQRPSPAVARRMGQQSMGNVGMKKGGATDNLFKGKETYGEELKEAKAIKSGKISPMQYAKGEKSEKKMASGGFTKSANGVAQRGLTRGKQVTMKRGGKC